MLDTSARGPSSVDALVLAAVHRIAHHFDSDHLIWLYDIDLIARSLTIAYVAAGRRWANTILMHSKRWLEPVDLSCKLFGKIL